MHAHGGDKGMTSLLSGERVPKTHPRVEACGEVDELASMLGVVAAALSPDQEDLRREIQAVQGDLMQIDAALAATPGSPALGMLRPLGKERIAALEGSIDRMQGSLPRLQGFVIPGGHPSAAWAHVARTVCRRAERRIAALAAESAAETATERAAESAAAPGGLPDNVLIYMNRLSTYLFVLARWCNRVHGAADLPWKG